MNDHKIKSIISNYGVTLKRLTEDKIELVRRWRNDPKIQQYMEFREEITPEMQKAWFQRINNDHNLYYIIEVDKKDVGLINCKDIDEEYDSGEGGIFIWDDGYLNSDLSFRATCLFYNYLFNDLGFKHLFGHVIDDNKRALNFNKALGIQKRYNVPEGDNRTYIVTKDSYVNCKALKIINKIYKNQ